MCRSQNEGVVKQSVHNMSFVSKVFEAGNIKMAQRSFLYSIPDGKAPIIVNDLAWLSLIDAGSKRYKEKSFWLLWLKAVNKAAAWTLGSIVKFSSKDAIFCKLGDDTYHESILYYHLSPMVSKLCVINRKASVKVVASIAGVLCAANICMTAEQNSVALQSLEKCALLALKWVFDSSSNPLFCQNWTESCCRNHVCFQSCTNS